MALAAVLASNNAIMESMEKKLNSISEATPSGRPVDNPDAVEALETSTADAEKKEHALTEADLEKFASIITATGTGTGTGTLLAFQLSSFHCGTRLLQAASLKDDHGLAQWELNSTRLKIKECDSQISSILKEQQQLRNKISETNLEKGMENEKPSGYFIITIKTSALHRGGLNIHASNFTTA
ncbi:hypothetical protein RND71_032198 [Anisodus tanguticus]|uniref:Uncharacterized protein n=1 Tax=Anisodus tanguticus TaxID=243964 RepID=A0AAE1RE48_9SOLA|nr:hypothetical protein RND71_032198 [Anisodus tanguticus]